MALVFRAAFIGRGLSVCAPKSSLLKIGLDSLLHGQLEYSCKALFTVSTALRRDYSTLSEKKRKLNEKSEEDIEVLEVKKTADGKEIVYEGMLATKIRNIKFFSLTTSVLTLTSQPLVYSKAAIAGATTSWTIPIFAVFGAFALATPLLLHYVTKRYIIQVRYDPVKDKYIALIYNIFVKVKEIEFTPKDITIPTLLGMFTTCAIKGKPMFLDAEGFPDQRHYVRIMGYDQPLNLHVDEEDIKKFKSQKKDSSDNV